MIKVCVTEMRFVHLYLSIHLFIRIYQLCLLHQCGYYAIINCKRWLCYCTEPVQWS